MKALIILPLLLFTGLIQGQNTIRTMKRLPDTGQSSSFTNTFGEDHDYTINPPFYLNHSNGTLTDTITGLMWQRTDGGEMTFEQAQLYCDTLTLGGYTDWRLPSPREAYSIMILQRGNPAIDINQFASTTAEYWWTGVAQYNDTRKVWVTNAGGGIGNHPKTETISAGGTKRFHVRAVRSTFAPQVLNARFVDHGDGTVSDLLTDLIWQKIPSTTALTWEQALSTAENLELGGANDWRLPNIKELESLTDFGVSNPSVSQVLATEIGVKKYWSSTTLVNQNTRAWYWDTQFGITTYDLKTNSNYLICVRSKKSIATAVQAIDVGLAGVHLYPNPAKDQCTLDFGMLLGGRVELRLVNKLGQQVWQSHLTRPSGSYKLHTAGLDNGCYFLQVQQGDKMGVFKLVVAH